MQSTLMLLLINIKCPAIEGFAENFGRFIPCRGGGTDTTYYTDLHEVDEDMVTISNQGGMWPNGNHVGIMYRTMNDTPTSSPDYVASRLIYLS